MAQHTVSYRENKNWGKKLAAHCLLTNEVVGQFIRDTENDCTFCNESQESILHLFWECNVSKNFIDNANEHIRENYPLYFSHWNRRNFVFSDQGSSILLPHNIFSLYLKYYIWLARCKGGQPILVSFLRFFNSEINLVKAAFRQKLVIDRLTCIN